MRRLVRDAVQGKRRAQRIFVKVAKPAEVWLGESGRRVFYLIDSEYKDKKPKSLSRVQTSVTNLIATDFAPMTFSYRT